MLCESKSQLKTMVHEIISNMGEGAMVRRLGSVYENGRSSLVAKIKVKREGKNNKYILK